MNRIHCDGIVNDKPCTNQAAPDHKMPGQLPEGWALVAVNRMAAGKPDKVTQISKTMITAATKATPGMEQAIDPGVFEEPPRPVRLMAQLCPTCAEALPLSSLQEAPDGPGYY